MPILVDDTAGPDLLLVPWPLKIGVVNREFRSCDWPQERGNTEGFRTRNFTEIIL